MLLINRIKIIDAARGIACLIVLIHHFIVFNGNNIKSLTSHFIWNILFFISDLNVEAVLFFFIISGFCIGLSLKGSLPITQKTIKVYIAKRLKRILPIYFLALIIASIAGIVTSRINGDPSYNLNNLIGNLLFLQTPEGLRNWFTPYGHNAPLWSLSYEFFFYLFFPLFSYVLVKKSIKNINIISGLLTIITIFSLVLNRFILFTPWFSYLNLFILWYYGYILLECFLYGRRYDLHFSIVFILSVLICVNKSNISSDSLYLVAEGLIMVSIFYSFIIAYRIQYFKLFLSRIEKILIFLFYQIGTGSYALYAIHYIILLLCAYFNATLSEIILILLITAFCCIKIEKLIIILMQKRFDLKSPNY